MTDLNCKSVEGHENEHMVNVVNKDDFTALIEAASSGNSDCVRTILKSEVDVNMLDSQGFTPLICASGNGHVECVNLLLKGGADANILDSEGFSPLICASGNGHVDCVNLLLKGGADVNMSNSQRSTPLICASGNGHVECVNLLLKGGADANILDSEGFSPLLCASDNGHVDCVNLLLKGGANVNTSDFEGSTALAWASSNGHVRCAEKLLAAGANVNQADNNGRTALMWATKSDDAGCVRLLVNSGADVNQADEDGSTSLTLAVTNGHYESVNLLLKEGADANAKDAYGNTALMFAAGRGHDLCVQFLLENGANVNQVASDSGETALITAAYAGQLKCTQVLLEAGADVNLERNDARTCVHNAAMQGHSDILRILVNADEGVANGKSSTRARRAGSKRVSILRKALANVCIPNQNKQLPAVLSTKYDHEKSRARVNKRDQDGMTPLMLAAMNGHDVCAKILLEKGADVKIHVYGFTALHFAAKHCHHRCTEVLLASGLNVNDLSWYHQETPLILAIQSGNIESLDALLKAGADVNQWTLARDTALTISVKRRHFKQAERLIESGADVNKPDGNGTPALSKAIEQHFSMGMINHMIELGVMNELDESNLVALDAQCMEIVKYLIKSGAFVNQTDNNGIAALSKAIIQPSSMEMISYLLASGADVNQLDYIGKSPLVYALEFGNPNLITYYSYNIMLIPTLLRAGARINTHLVQGEDSCVYVGFHSHTDLYKTLADLLYAAGEEDEKYEHLPDYLPDESEINLMNICRRVIRQHLLSLDLHTHLFARVPKLGLPASLEKYLVYSLTLDGDESS